MAVSGSISRQLRACKSRLVTIELNKVLDTITVTRGNRLDPLVFRIGGDIYLPVYQIVFKKRSYLFVRDILSVAQGATIKKYSIVIWRNAAKLCICPESLRLVGKEMRLLNDFDYSAGAFSG